MQVHILIDNGSYEFISLFRSKKALFKSYLSNMKNDEDTAYFDATLERLRTGKSDIGEESKTELIRAFESKHYDINLIDIHEYLQEHDADKDYFSRILPN